MSKHEDEDGCAAERNPLRLHMREAEEAKRLSARLLGQPLPDVELTTAQAEHVSLHAYTGGIVVVYFVPGDKHGPYEKGHPTPDSSQHRGFVNRKAGFASLRLKVICVSGQDLAAVQDMAHYFKFSHVMFSDPQLLLAEALDLPTSTSNGTTYYRRLTMVCNEGCIQKVIYPIADRDAAGNARQVLTWIKVAGW